jgi:uncharacterized SAM-binding protein YcdF (DUF218 family)
MLAHQRTRIALATGAEADRPRTGGLRPLLGLAVGTAGGSVSFLLGAFLMFTLQVAGSDDGPARVSALPADGIVVLTGGRDRVQHALGLLSEGSGHRLLISGVNPETSADAIARETDAAARWFSCCVDLGYGALNTWGNAAEARLWARTHRFQSMIIVTSAYHMPRSMAAMRAALPDVRLVPHAVRHARLSVERWWADPAAAQVLAFEFVKYIVARVRLDLGARIPDPAGSTTGSINRPPVPART